MTRSQDRYDRFAEAVDSPMLVITILWLPVLIVPLVTPVHGAVAASLEAIDFTVWALFALEYIVKFALAPDRGHYFKTHILELIVVVVPFLRPLRVVVSLGRVGVVFAESLRRAKSILTHNGFHFVVLTAAYWYSSAQVSSHSPHPWFWPQRAGYSKEDWFDYIQEVAIRSTFNVTASNIELMATHVHRPIEIYFARLTETGL